MADGDTVKMKLTFWRDGKKPGDVIDVPVDEVHRWTGFAKPVDEPAAAAKSSAVATETAKAK
ncbi:hypothetical protein ACKI14_02715 [Streptomyces turgidiscabies]|uniref:hypothetical protein n=1 Tax=Streptomyces turgidiscabies TaxID=85558 RepID=UPI0038F72A44